MGHLGDFGTTHDAVDLTFGWFGSKMRVHPNLTDLAILELAGSMTGVSDEDGAGVAEVVRGMAAALVHADDVHEFWVVARANRQTMRDVADLAARLIAGLSDRPTQLPSDSSDGQPRTGVSSTGVSSSPAMAILNGRPDLQVAVLRSEARLAG